MDIVDPAIEDYAAAHTTPPPGALPEVAAATWETMPSPRMMTAPVEARLLEALVATSGARRALEVGTFTGFGALTLAAALPDDGEVVTIENDQDTAAIARENIDSSEYGSKVRLIVGDAREELDKLDGPFDLVYIDAWKADYVHYYESALSMLSERGIIVADNVLWSGRVLEADVEGEAAGVKAFNEHVQADSRVHNVLLSVGDGLMLAWRA